MILLSNTYHVYLTKCDEKLLHTTSIAANITLSSDNNVINRYF